MLWGDVRCAGGGFRVPDGLLEQRLVAAEVIAHQRATPGAKELSGMAAAAPFGKVEANEDERLHRVQCGAAVSSQIGPVCLAIARPEHRYQRFVGHAIPAGPAVLPLTRPPMAAVAVAGAKPARQGKCGNFILGLLDDVLLLVNTVN